MHLCLCTYVRVHAHMYKCVHAYLHICIYANMYICVCVYVNVNVNVYVYVYVGREGERLCGGIGAGRVITQSFSGRPALQPPEMGEWC